MSKLLLVGAPASTSLLARYMLSYTSLCAAEENSTLDNILLEAKQYIADDSFQLCVTNKYYDTSLHCKLCADLDANNIDIYESILAIPDDTNAVSSNMSLLSSTLQERREDGVFLCVVLKDCNNAEGVDAYRAARVDWCIDAGFEYIEVDTALPVESHQDRDKFGVPRVLEALQSNRWRHMNLKSQQKQQAEEPPQNRAPEEIMTSVFRADAADSDSYLNDEDDPQEKQMQEVLQMAQRTREEAMAGTLSDAQRRERAAQIALQMCSLMSLDDDSDDGSNED